MTKENGAVPQSTVAKHTITITFEGDDIKLYERIMQDAKAERRSPSQFVLLHLVNNYETQPAE